MKPERREPVTTLITILFFGIAYGMILYLISVGLSVTMGLMGFVNLAHGVFAMLGGYATVTLMNRFAVPFLASLAIGCIVVSAIGFVLERVFYRRFYGRSELDQVLFSFGLILVAVALVRIAWGPLAQPIQLPNYLKGQVAIFGLALPAYRLGFVGFGAAVIAGAWFCFAPAAFGGAYPSRRGKSRNGAIDWHQYQPAVCRRLWFGHRLGCVRGRSRCGCACHRSGLSAPVYRVFSDRRCGGRAWQYQGAFRRCISNRHIGYRLPLLCAGSRIYFYFHLCVRRSHLAS